MGGHQTKMQPPKMAVRRPHLDGVHPPNFGPAKIAKQKLFKRENLFPFYADLIEFPKLPVFPFFGKIPT